MKNIHLFLILIFVAMFVVGCEENNTAPNNSGSDLQNNDDNVAKEETNTNSGIFGPKYSGTILAGKEAPYIEFNTEDYQKATEDGKIILLYFYSLQSAPSKADQTTVQSAFNEMTNPNIIGFRVNFDDEETSASEQALATQLGVKTARTKIIMKDGKVMQRSTSTDWNANDYIRQITQYLD